MSTIHSSSLTGFLAVTQELGGDAAALLAEVGLPQEVMHSPNVLLPLQKACEVMDLAAVRLNCPDFGLRTSQAEQTTAATAGGSVFGSVAVAFRNAESMAEAVDIADRYLRLHSAGTRLTVETDPFNAKGVVALRHSWPADQSPFVQMRDRALLNLHHWIVTLAGGGYGLRSVELSYSSLAPARVLSAAFGGVRVRLEQPRTVLRVPKSLLQQSIVDSDQTLRRIALFYLAQQQAPSEALLITQVKAIIRSLLGTRATTINTVARAMEIPPRTLQHRLRAQETSFRELLDEVRREEAVVLLRRTDLSMSDVAAMLDFDSQATLSRASRRWWGLSPTQKRHHASSG